MTIRVVDRRTQTFGFTLLALIAFAANSVLCRIALRGGSVDPATFSSIRFVSAAAILLLLSRWRQHSPSSTIGSWRAAFVLALYAVPFSLAYVKLAAATGALILFGSVQLTMVISALRDGHRPGVLEWGGLMLAVTGMLWLVLPGLEAPPLAAAALMTVAGICWGSYSLLGQRSADPLQQTTSNVVRVVPMLLLVNLIAMSQWHVEVRGVVLAAASGTLASGVGYVIWYAALRRLTAMRAAIVQLAVPILAAVGGVVLLAEPVSTRLVVAAALVLGGIALSTVGRQRVSRR